MEEKWLFFFIQSRLLKIRGKVKCIVIDGRTNSHLNLFSIIRD